MMDASAGKGASRASDATTGRDRGRGARRGRGERPAAASALAAALLGFALAVSPAPARAADMYDSKESGHPLRIVAYVVHPVGVALDYLIMRPAYWVGSHEPFRTLFGRTD